MSRTIHELLDEALLHFSFIDRYAQLDLEDSLVLDAITSVVSRYRQPQQAPSRRKERTLWGYLGPYVRNEEQDCAWVRND